MRRAIGIVVAAVIVMAPTSAHAAFPGANGKIAFTDDTDSDGELLAVQTATPGGPFSTSIAFAQRPAWAPDGTKLAFETAWCCEVEVAGADGSNRHSVRGDASEPAWSPDGTKIVFRDEGFGGLWVMNADGTGAVFLPEGGSGEAPAWSPDGSRIAFSDGAGIWTVASDGTEAQELTTTPDKDPDWSPDGAKLAVTSTRDGDAEIFVMNSDGTGAVNLTSNSVADTDPAWSPDGQKIAFTRDRTIWAMNADGSGQSQLVAVSSPSTFSAPSWQPLPAAGYPRPKGAGPIHMSLVPRYMPCISPNRVHGPPLAFGSCSPPERSSTYLTVGTPDANGQPVKSTAYVRFDVQIGDPSTPADEADVALNLSVSDVRLSSDLTDYTGMLQAQPTLRVTDKDNTPHPGGPGPGTVTDFNLPFPAPCVATTDTTVGATCTASTSVEALAAGAVKEKRRAIWQLERFEVGDGGPQASPMNRPFLVPGLFVP